MQTDKIQKTANVLASAVLALETGILSPDADQNQVKEFNNLYELYSSLKLNLSEAEAKKECLTRFFSSKIEALS